MRKDFFNEKTENMIYNRQAAQIVNSDRLPD